MRKLIYYLNEEQRETLRVIIATSWVSTWIINAAEIRSKRFLSICESRLKFNLKPPFSEIPYKIKHNGQTDVSITRTPLHFTSYWRIKGKTHKLKRGGGGGGWVADVEQAAHTSGFGKGRRKLQPLA